MRILIPAKPLDRAKSRLGGFLGPEERAQLVLWMLERVLRCAQAAGPEELYVVGGDSEIERVAARFGSGRIPELGPDLNGTLERALERMRGRPCLILASDLPLLTPGDLRCLEEAGGRLGGVILAPSRDGSGTNAVFLPASIPFRPAFGPASRRRHRTWLERAGVRVGEVHRIGLAHDIDRPEDLTPRILRLPGFPIPRLCALTAPLERSRIPDKPPWSCTSSRRSWRWPPSAASTARPKRCTFPSRR